MARTRATSKNSLWVTTREYAAMKGITRRTVQDWIKTRTGKMEEETRRSSKKKGAKGSGFEVLIKDAADIEKILAIREEAKTNPPPKAPTLKERLNCVNKEIARLRGIMAKKEAEISKLKALVITIRESHSRVSDACDFLTK